jgi:hypothetical protein
MLSQAASLNVSHIGVKLIKKGAEAVLGGLRYLRS